VGSLKVQHVGICLKPDQLTLICENQEPYDLKVKGNGKITFYKHCTGYGSQVRIRSLTEGNVNNTQNDVIPPLDTTARQLRVTKQ
jgi:hypothetical protein